MKCEVCGAHVEASEADVGKEVVCGSCGAVYEVEVLPSVEAFLEVMAHPAVATPELTISPATVTWDVVITAYVKVGLDPARLAEDIHRRPMGPPNTTSIC